MDAAGVVIKIAVHHPRPQRLAIVWSSTANMANVISAVSCGANTWRYFKRFEAESLSVRMLEVHVNTLTFRQLETPGVGNRV